MAPWSRPRREVAACRRCRVGATAALEQGQAADLLQSLPDGLDSLLGKEFGGGTDLSEGQWQNVAISRALMLDAPLLLVLDEPTSGLDADAEHALFERYASAASRAGRAVGAVTVLVPHRFSTVRLADLIVVVDGGRISEQGSNAELVDADGLYAESTVSRPAPTAEQARACAR